MTPQEKAEADRKAASEARDLEQFKQDQLRMSIAAGDFGPAQLELMRKQQQEQLYGKGGGGGGGPGGPSGNPIDILEAFKQAATKDLAKATRMMENLQAVQELQRQRTASNRNLLASDIDNQSKSSEQYLTYLSDRGKTLLSHFADQGATALGSYLKSTLEAMDFNRSPVDSIGYSGISKFAPRPTEEQVKGTAGYQNLLAKTEQQTKQFGEKNVLDMQEARLRAETEKRNRDMAMQKFDVQARFEQEQAALEYNRALQDQQDKQVEYAAQAAKLAEDAEPFDKYGNPKPWVKGMFPENKPEDTRNQPRAI